jgi:hypothetical protein
VKTSKKLAALPPVLPEIERDRWGRPLVVPPTGGKKIGYTRCTTFVGSIEDTYKLGQWLQRHAIRGTALHDDIIAAVRDTDANDRASLDRLAEEAKERSGAGDAARLGTYLHSVTEAADRGLDPSEVARPWLSTGDLDPTAYVADLAAYEEATQDMTAVAIEQFTVQDPLKIGGTPDRVVELDGKRYIADLKTGSIEWGGLKIAAQLAVYARSRPYNVETHERMDPHGAETDRGIVIHLPAGTGTCRLYWVDLKAGWDAVRLCRDVRQRRSVGFRHLFNELVPVPSMADPEDDLPLLITASESADQVRTLWAANASRWTEKHTELAKAHIAGLAGETTNNTTTEGARA